MTEQVKNRFIGTSVEVRTPEDYGIAIAAYVMAGADIAQWHRGYEIRNSDRHRHHLYGWALDGFTKLDNGSPDGVGTYPHVSDLLRAVKEHVYGHCFPPSEVGQLVEPVLRDYALRSGAQAYAQAVVVSVEPFALASVRGDMRWEWNIKPSFFTVVGMANQEQLEGAMRREFA